MNEIIYAFDSAELLAQSRSELLSEIKAVGFDGLEVPVHPDFVGVRGVNDLAVLKELLSQSGLSAPALAAFWGSPCDPSQAELMNGLFRTLADLGTLTHSRLGVMRVGGCPPEGGEDCLKSLAGALIAASNHCEPAGMEVALEFQENSFLGSYADAKDWLYFHDPQVGLAVDTASLANGGADPLRAMVELGPLVKMIYLTEPLDSHRFNHQELFAALKGAEFSGPFAIRPATFNRGALENSVLAVRQYWSEVHPETAAIVEA